MEQLITTNEVMNSGHSIYLYQDQSSEIWSAWGYSAYLLARIEGINLLSSFSKKLQMPCVSITDTTLKMQLLTKIKAIETAKGVCQLPINQNVESKSYQRWANSLKK